MSELKVSSYPIANTLSLDDRVLVLVNATSNASVRTANVSTIRATSRRYAVKSNTQNTIQYDYRESGFFVHQPPANNWTVNLTNLAATNNTVHELTLFVEQGNTAYTPNSFQINAAPQIVRWKNNTPPTGTANRTNIFKYIVVYDGSTYKICGDYDSF
jgi:hypothetical protein